MGVALEDLGQAVKRLQYRHHRTLDAKLMPLGITLVQWDALRAISQHPDASSHRLAQLTFQTDQSFGALAGRLVTHGLIDRVPGPGRALRHHLTPAGEELLSKGYTVVNEVLAQSFSSLSSTEKETLYDLLTRLLHPQN
ncbi:MarR family winged helix-turn-helix transcriptional regulator [Dictyobacter kobayashii]|uniref:MarR family transcriptional regulator n=1 Tax=Dictyobacter kobayashii TaxID=2014872 RepID=A0A402ASS0_9CHLR|nr:MarR family transcriptional regulator [Dictyobacter kobayashii]GCE22132.1 MarR family transcriptional regulator [Dictyobacter kobayashii]